MSVCFDKEGKNLCAPIKSRIGSKVLTITRQHGIFVRRASKNKNKLTVSSRGIYFRSSSNNTQSSPPYRVGIKIKALPEEKYNKELPAGIGDYYTYYPLIIDYGFNMGDMTL